MYMKHSIISPWPVPELTGAQWVEPLPQASYKFTSSSKLQLYCISENTSTNNDYLLLSLVSAQFYNPASIEFKSFIITSEPLKDCIKVIASTSILTLTTYPYMTCFASEMQSNAEFALSFEDLFKSDHLESILG